MAEATVRVATGDDVAAIADVHRDAWTTAYAELLPPDVLAGLGGPEARRAWADAVSGGATVLIAGEGDSVVGFCVAGQAPAEEVAEPDGPPVPDASSVVLVSTLLVAPRWGRRGHGGRLLATAGLRLHEAGATRGIAWLLGEDAASLNFFRRAGWQPDGTVRVLDAGTHSLRELRVTGPLDLRLS